MSRTADGARTEAAQALGARIRAVRLQRDLSLGDLAGLAQVSKSLISQIERGVAAPSIETVRKLASALDVPVFSFFLEPQGQGMLVRAGERRRVSYPDSAVVREVLSPNLNGRMVLLAVTFPPGAESGADFVHHAGEETVVVIEGALEVQIGDQSVALETGDALTFDAELPHRFRNPSLDVCQLVVAISPPHL